jgi:hypothetical protein
MLLDRWRRVQQERPAALLGSHLPPTMFKMVVCNLGRVAPAGASSWRGASCLTPEAGFAATSRSDGRIQSAEPSVIVAVEPAW